MPSNAFLDAFRLAGYLGVDPDIFFNAGYPHATCEADITLQDAIDAIEAHGI